MCLQIILNMMKVPFRVWLGWRDKTTLGSQKETKLNKQDTVLIKDGDGGFKCINM